jgi:hypothetical protein
MPLPKLPTRPAAILDLTTLERNAKAPSRAIEEIQPDLDGLTSAQPVLHKVIEAPAARPAACSAARSALGSVLLCCTLCLR